MPTKKAEKEGQQRQPECATEATTAVGRTDNELLNIRCIGCAGHDYPDGESTSARGGPIS
jgi:hypothetical protein